MKLEPVQLPLPLSGDSAGDDNLRIDAARSLRYQSPQAQPALYRRFKRRYPKALYASERETAASPMIEVCRRLHLNSFELADALGVNVERALALQIQDLSARETLAMIGQLEAYARAKNSLNNALLAANAAGFTMLSWLHSRSFHARRTFARRVAGSNGRGAAARRSIRYSKQTRVKGYVAPSSPSNDGASQ